MLFRIVGRLGTTTQWALCSGVFLSLSQISIAPNASAELVDSAYEMLVDRARTLSRTDYQPLESPLPQQLAELDYDGHRDIRCPPGSFLWADTEAPFRVQFKHRGWLFKEIVALSSVTPDGREIVPKPFTPEHFTYGPVARENLDPASLPSDLGYAGLSLHRVGPKDEKGEETYNELLSIQGGSYFRAVGDGQHWGSSVRGIAINTATAGPEEFPRWRELWVRQPQPGDDHSVIYGLLDGPTLTGAYRLDVTPGPTLTVDVEARLFLRSVPEKLGIAPITSMFLFGEDHPARFNDYRPEVHDADGLLMQHSDDSLEWRPLRNPPRLAVSRFAMERPKGFGLMQRDRSFASYEDLETEMNIRPSVWVRLHGDWGKGAVELLEIASDDEGVDNIGAYWVQTDREYQPGEEIALSYSLDFTQDPRPVGREKMAFVQTRWLISDGSEGGSVVRTAASEDGQPVARFLIDTSDGSALPNGTIVKPDVTVNKGELIGEPIVQYNRFADSYRLFFDVQRLGEEPVELRATLREDDGSPHSETWVYRWE